MLTEIWKDKLSTLNAYINEGKFTFHAQKLKAGIKEILECLPIINRTMEDCMAKGDNEGRQNLFRIKADMEQTCWRFECMNHGKKIEPFRSAFEGNNRNYFFNKDKLFEEKEYIPYSNAEKEDNKFRTGFEKFGHAVKDSFISFGKAVKKTTVSGYNYVKEKLSDEPTNQQVSDDCYSYSKNPQITNKTYGYNDYNKRNNNNNNNGKSVDLLDMNDIINSSNNNNNSYNNSYNNNNNFNGNNYNNNYNNNSYNGNTNYNGNNFNNNFNNNNYNNTIIKI
jgi:hypothetical protein